MSTPDDLLFKFETTADVQASQLRLWKQPLRSILSAIFLAADRDFSGGRFSGHGQPNIERGATILSRLSYLMPFMRSSSSEIGESLADALGALDEQSISEIQSALGYAHFCEIMPMVRNGYLRVEHAERGFELVHPSPQFSHHEQCDVIASEMALPFLERPFPFRVSTLLKMSSDWPRLVAEDFLPLLMDSYRHHFASIYERELLSSADYLKAFDFERDGTRLEPPVARPQAATATDGGTVKGPHED